MKTRHDFSTKNTAVDNRLFTNITRSKVHITISHSIIVQMDGGHQLKQLRLLCVLHNRFTRKIALK